MDFDSLFEEYFDKVYYKVLSIVKNSDDAEDISQEVFMSVYKNLNKFREESNIYTWIYRIAINKTYDFFKKKKVELEMNEEVLLIADEFNSDTNIILQEKLNLISEKEKEIVILKDIYGYKLKEIADMKNLNLSTVKSIYYKALKDMGGEK
ncbi:RNA polymerase sigma factor [Fusobacterium gastrosuis]|uniref:RNA polymerase sigma factor n=1 Tax=Fusobacterium gastrosuis TaxID=1755100 RepID=UPI001F4F8132|nr:RNA polymerase sigma factor [Fusobacterium gastrosuis]MDD7410470.1 RNA polymerase sigma factor [Fusobacteriaceae bacterium]MDY5305531.1 RNA polymerase sigma factor [Fusobacterium gastrosuis]MDY5712803.1 RNA polymerase sigma factor [Fusobacterium gastrosuis]